MNKLLKWGLILTGVYFGYKFILAPRMNKSGSKFSGSQEPMEESSQTGQAQTNNPAGRPGGSNLLTPVKSTLLGIQQVFRQQKPVANVTRKAPSETARNSGATIRNLL